MKTKTVIGRPRLPNGKALTELRSVRFRPDEAKSIEGAAEKRGVSVADFIRAAAITASAA